MGTLLSQSVLKWEKFCFLVGNMNATSSSLKRSGSIELISSFKVLLHFYVYFMVAKDFVIYRHEGSKNNSNTQQ